MIRRVCRVTAALCLVAIPLVLTISAGADAASSFGWWYQLNDSTLPVAPPPPPNAPSGGIYVQGTLAGASAYGAVHFSSPGTTAGVAKLTVESQNGAVEVALCPTTAAWLPADGGVWQKAPAFDCSTHKVLGVIAADGATVSFEITDALGTSGEYDLALVPDPTAQTVFSLSLSAPGPDFFTPTADTPSTLPPVSTPPPYAGDFNSDAPSTLGAPFPDVGGTTGAGNFLEAPTTSAPVAAATPVTRGDDVTRLPVQPVSNTDTSGQRMMAGMALALLAGGLWLIGNRSAGNLTPELVRAGAINSHGGVGRFARVRTATPTRVA